MTGGEEAMSQDREGDRKIVLRPIGLIRTPFMEPRGTPIQPSAAKDTRGHIELREDFCGGLKDLEGFSHIILLYHFHLSGPAPLRVVPYMDEEERGVFATRAPARPNPLGISTVRLDSVEGNTIHIRDVDIVDRTPLLDVKPFVPQFEETEKVRYGWLEREVHKLPHSRDDGRFID